MRIRDCHITLLMTLDGEREETEEVEEAPGEDYAGSKISGEKSGREQSLSK